MKFVCPSCKSKYQIADEKVAGRSVRMKCRKCGHVIHIGTADTQPRLDRADSLPPRPMLAAGGGSPAAHLEPKLARNPAVPARSPEPPAVTDSPKSPAAAKPAHPPSRAAHQPSTAQGAGRAGAGAASLTQGRAPLPRSGSLAGGPRAAARPPTAKAEQVQEPPKRLVTAMGPPLRGALHDLPLKAERAPASAPRALEPAPEPAPPGRPAARAAAPAPPVRALAQAPVEPRDYDEQEDQEEQDAEVRISSPGALHGAFAQAVAAGAPKDDAPASHADEWFVGIDGAPVGPIPLAELRAKASAGRITGDSLVWRDGFENWQALKKFPELIAVMEEGLSSARAAAEPLAPPGAAVSLVAAPSPGAEAPSTPLATGTAVVVEAPSLEELAGLPSRRGGPKAAWVAIAVAPLFGLTLGFVLWGGKSEVKTVVEYRDAPAKESKGEAAAKGEPKATEEQAPNAGEGSAKRAARKGRAQATTPAAGAAEQPVPAGGLAGLQGLKALGGNGPNAGPGSTRQASGGQPLDTAQIETTVNRYRASVKRSCWQPALDTRARDAPSGARVTVTITVSASGSVTGASTSGDPVGYRGLASCIASRVRGWQFPASSGTTTVNVPFVFAAQ